MKVIMVMFDSLNRHMLPPYGCDWVHAPNFQRLAERTVTFNRSYVCSMPCMPARRDLHTARPNFLHTPWSPIQPYDDSVPQILQENGIYTHLASDHYHYWEDGGATYHGRYSSWEAFRGHEGDFWKGQVAPPQIPDTLNQLVGRSRTHDWVNRKFMPNEEDQPQPQTFKAGLDFIRRNHQEDNWFLQIETFDPHEPFFSHRKYKDRYAEHYQRYKGKHFDWPSYRFVEESPEEVEHCRYEYASLLGMCDAYLGDVLDTMDELNLWEDTMLIVWTDHGFLLGEHECWAKCWMPFYEEVAHTPFFIWDPRSGAKGQTRDALVQPSIDLGPTLLGAFGLEPTPDMQGKDLAATIAGDKPVREAAMFGIFGGHVNVTDGRYVYMRDGGNGAACDGETNNGPLYEYTLMPTRMRGFPKPEELRQAELVPPLPFTKGMPVLRIPHEPRPIRMREKKVRHLLFDLQTDPRQERPIQDPAVEERMIELMVQLMRDNHAPAEQYQRLGLTTPVEAGV